MAESTPHVLAASPAFDAGIAHLAAGDRAAARRRLIAALKAQPWSAEGWLWLRAAVDTDRERAFCLQKALAAAADDGALDPAVVALRSGDEADARRELVLRLKSGGQRARDWLWLAACLDDAQRAGRCVEEAVALEVAAGTAVGDAPHTSQVDAPGAPAANAPSTTAANAPSTTAADAPNTAAVDAPDGGSPEVGEPKPGARRGKVALVALAGLAGVVLLIVCAAILLVARYWTQRTTEEITTARSAYTAAVYLDEATQINNGYRVARLELESEIAYLYGVTDLRALDVFIPNAAPALAQIRELNARVAAMRAPEDYAAPQAHLDAAATHYTRFADLFEDALRTLDAKKLVRAWDELALGDDSLEQAIQALR